MNRFFALLAIAGMFFLASCGGNSQKHQEEGQSQADSAAQELLKEAEHDHGADMHDHSADADSTAHADSTDMNADSTQMDADMDANAGDMDGDAAASGDAE